MNSFKIKIAKNIKKSAENISIAILRVETDWNVCFTISNMQNVFVCGPGFVRHIRKQKNHFYLKKWLHGLYFGGQELILIL